MTLKEKKAWLLLLSLSLFARLAGLGLRALSHDESLHAMYSWYLSNGLSYQHDPMMHGPLLFHLNGLLFSLFPATDFTARLLPALVGTGCVAMPLLFRSWLGTWGAFWAAVLISLDPGHLFFSRYLRNDIYITLFTLLMVWAAWRYREDQRPRYLILLSLGLSLSFASKEVCFIHGVMLGAGCGLFSMLETVRHPNPTFREWLRHPWMHCAILLLLLALPFLTGLLVGEGTWSPPGAVDPDIQTRGITVGLGLVAITLIVGTAIFRWLNQWRSWIISAALFWFIQATLFTSLLTNLRGGIASGLAGSLGYWWAQHEVQRGNPDPAFYLTLLLLYTPVLLLGGLLAARRIKQIPYAFLLFWTVVHLGIYSWAGERMPWLLIHISLPLCLLTGSILPNLFRKKGLRARILQAVMMVGLVQLTFNSLRLTGPNAAGAREPLVYAHSGSELKTALFLVETHLKQNPGTRAQVDPAYAWPTAWYFREMPVGYTEVTTPEDISPDTSALFVAPSRREDFRAAGWISRIEVDLTTWPRQRYHRISRQNLRALIQNPSVRTRLLKYVLTREQPEWREGEFPAPNRFLLMSRSP